MEAALGDRAQPRGRLDPEIGATTLRPLAPRSRAERETAGRMRLVAWMTPPLWVSSKSRPRSRIPLMKAASRIGIRSGVPMTYGIASARQIANTHHRPS